MIYHIYANQSNIGDWLSAKGIQQLLAGEEIRECFCDEPFVEETIAVLANAKDTDLVIIGGGGLLMDYFVPFWESFASVAKRIPFCIWSVGYCDIKHETSLPPNKLIEDIVRSSRLCIVRDELTRSHLPGCNIPEPVPCTSINVIEATAKGWDLLHVVNYSTATPKVYEFMCETGNAFATRTGRVYRETNNIISKGNEDDLKNVLSLYKRSDLIISSALHGCIIGVTMGKKVLAVSGDRKIEGFMQQVGLQDWVIDIKEVDRMTSYLEKLKAQKGCDELIELSRMKNQVIAQKIKQMLIPNT